MTAEKRTGRVVARTVRRLADAEPAAMGPAWRAPFLDALAGGLSPAEAAHRAGVPPEQPLQAAFRDDAFQAECKRAQKFAEQWRVQEADHALWARHVEGIERPVFYGGEQRGTVREFDTAAGRTWLAAHDPHYQANPPAEPGNLTVVLNLSGHPDCAPSDAQAPEQARPHVNA